LFLFVVSSITAVFGVQMATQVWAPTEPRTVTPCEPGLRELLAAIETARDNASRQIEEAEALSAFRAAMAEPWKSVPGLRRSKLQVLERLRYAEEHAVRYNSVELARQRRRVQDLLPGPAVREAERAPAPGQSAGKVPASQ
jgi:hypothetical protein